MEASVCPLFSGQRDCGQALEIGNWKLIGILPPKLSVSGRKTWPEPPIYRLFRFADFLRRGFINTTTVTATLIRHHCQRRIIRLVFQVVSRPGLTLPSALSKITRASVHAEDRLQLEIYQGLLLRIIVNNSLKSLFFMLADKTGRYRIKRELGYFLGSHRMCFSYRQKILGHIPTKISWVIRIDRDT